MILIYNKQNGLSVIATVLCTILHDITLGRTPVTRTVKRFTTAHHTPAFRLITSFRREPDPLAIGRCVRAVGKIMTKAAKRAKKTEEARKRKRL